MHKSLQGVFMRKTHLHLLVLSALVVALIAAGPCLAGGKLFAMQQGSTGSGNVSGSGQSNTGPGTSNNPDVNNGTNTNNSNGTTTNNPATNNPSDGNYLGSGSGSSQQNAGQAPGAAGAYGPGTQANSDVARANAPWGWMILSFIVGLIVGGLAFRRTVYRDRIDRTDIHRAA
jgi:hypothetical protein